MSISENKKVKQYLDSVCRLVKNKKVHEIIAEELLCHIEEVVEEYIEQGKAEDEAIEQAILQMGSYEDVGKNLNKVHKVAPDWALIVMTATLILVGIVTLWTMGKHGDYTLYKRFMSNTIGFSVIGLAIAAIIVKFNYKGLRRFSKYIYIVTMAACIVIGPISNVVSGARGWIILGPFSFNIYNIAPFFLIIALAGILEKWNWNNIKSTLLGLVIVIFPAILLMFNKSGASSIIYTVAAITLMIISGIRIKNIMISIASIGVIITLMLISHPYRIDRLLTFMEPSKDPDGAGWIYNQLNKIINSSKLLGNGQEFNFAMLPDVHTDFILTYIIYSFGFIACIALVTLVLGFILRIGFIAKKTKDNYGKLLVGGLCALFAVQFIFNILMNFTLTPALSIGLPFISYSGSSVVINIISISIITSVCKWRNTPCKIG